ncbi:MAG: class I SAM-dependent methyltransferase [Alphaproteobacteria bacterium]|nr:class I SAM-dependent methyltransferase [Alphaproteobacteria bacterium]
MSRRLAIDDALYDYLLDHGTRETEAQRRLRAETATIRGAGMQISPEQGQLMGLLVRLIGAKRALEIGTFTGYSALTVALALPPDGRLLCGDVNEAWTEVARRHWEAARVAAKIELRLAPALETLAELRAQRQDGSFDFAFIDADKDNYDAYYEHCLVLVRPGGLIAIDNVLWSGRVLDAKDRSADTQALRALNAKLKDDKRIDLTMVPIGDGLTLARVR